MILGVIVGFAGLVWQFFGLITNDYEGFKKNVSLLKSFYTVDNNVLDHNYKSQKMNKSTIGSEGPNDNLGSNIKRKISKHAEYQYTYWNSIEASILSCCCCCFKDKACHRTAIRR
jgi:hypothetical protein